MLSRDDIATIIGFYCLVLFLTKNQQITSSTGELATFLGFWAL